jgi:hypothetical protein
MNPLEIILLVNIADNDEQSDLNERNDEQACETAIHKCRRREYQIWKYRLPLPVMTFE